MSGVAASKQPRVTRELRTAPQYGDVSYLNIDSGSAVTKYYEVIVNEGSPVFSRDYCITTDKIAPSFFTYTNQFSKYFSSNFLKSVRENCDNEGLSLSPTGRYHQKCSEDLEFGGLPERESVRECVTAACIGIYKGFNKETDLKCQSTNQKVGCNENLPLGEVFSSNHTDFYDHYIENHTHAIEPLEEGMICDEQINLSIEFVRETLQNGQAAITFNVEVNEI